MRRDHRQTRAANLQSRAGDLLIWNSQLPHGVSPNKFDRPQLAQYISMSSAQEHNEQARQWRINSWLHRIAPEGNPFPGDPRGWERNHGTTAALTPLGRKLPGLDSWGDVDDGGTSGDMRTSQQRGRKRATPGSAS
jgi:hypothetical protein